MPTIFTHALLPLAAGAALGTARLPPHLIAAGMLAAVLPDADVVAFKLGINYAHALGHRGASHSLMFASLCGMIAACGTRWFGAPARATFLFIALSAASHPLLDMFTDGGLGVALFWPWSDARHFAPWRMIEVSPFANRFFSARGIEVLLSELRWVWLPALIVAGWLAWLRRRMSSVGAT
ncbi:metal-dependent hydrolase [uncultured Pseudoxanthomonas sp.]|uniref:metal-dependent hydrolase n=1 Tax=uncultured Pseudoxanthomonas sp. TaxID=281701 RepID=UPI0026372E92|nr:metal-dependent hydrolase [uncultured Pseudoxanthomonas sp.]